MGALIGNEIIQTRLYDDPNAVDPPNLNYKHAFPITVFDAVRENYSEDSRILKDIIDEIYTELKNKQPIFPGRPANYLMTFAGVPGATGAIEISNDIPWDPAEQSHDRIPTEKAVADLMYKLGLLDDEGNPIDPETRRVRWADIIGRPILYDSLGDNKDGVVIQKAINDAINAIYTRMDEDQNSISQVSKDLGLYINKLTTHTSDFNNPHNVTASQVGAVGLDAFNFHTSNIDNPHQVTKSQVGLSNVDNTSDMDKPISIAVQNAIDILNNSINEINTDINDLQYVVDAEYDLPSGNLTLIYRNGSIITLHIPIYGMFQDADYDINTKELILTRYNGDKDKVDLSDLFIRYLGSVGNEITISIDGNQTTGYQIINASINPKSIISDKIVDQNIIEPLIADQSISTRTIQDQSIINDKLADDSISTRNIIDRSITLDKLDPSPVSNRIIATLENGTTPVWTRVIEDMIDDSQIVTRHIRDDSITGDKIADSAVTSSKIHDNAIITSKLDNEAVTNDKIDNSTITGDKFVDDINIPGTPHITVRPLEDSYDSSIPDTKWVKDRLDKVEIRNDNILDRAVDGRTLFSSINPNRVLVVESPGTDPYWGQIKEEMLLDDSISTRVLRDDSVTGDKIADQTITSLNIKNRTIENINIADDAIDSSKIWPSELKNRVLAAINDNGNPVYTQVNQEMMEPNSVGVEQLIDGSVSPAKIESSDTSNRVLAVRYKNTVPEWTRVTNQMLDDRSVDGRVLFTSPQPNRVLAVNPVYGTDPAWLQIVGEMIHAREIDRHHILAGAIWKEHLQPKIIESQHIADWSIRSNNIAPKSIGGIELFTSAVPNRILGVDSMPYSNAQWMQVVTDMVEDEAITGDKIFRTDLEYRVLGATNASAPPEYLKITGDFVTDHSLPWTKMEPNPVFIGTAWMTERPAPDADNKQVPDTRWVRQTVMDMVTNFSLLWQVVTGDMIANKSIDGTKLMTTDKAPRVLGITHPNEDVEFLLIERDLIVNGAVSTEKLDRNLTLMGSPHLEVRPSPNASTVYGGGTLIPDCQWVLDRIADSGIGSGGGSVVTPSTLTIDDRLDILEGIVGSGLYPAISTGDETADYLARLDRLEADSGVSSFGPISTGDDYADILDRLDRLESVVGKIGSSNTTTGGAALLYNSVTGNHIQNRAVDGSKLFSSAIANRLLGVLEPYTDPQYLQANNEMLGDRSVDGRTLFSSSVPNRILGVESADSDPTWTVVSHDMLGDESVGYRNMMADAVATDNIQDYSITGIKFVEAPVVDTIHIHNEAVTNDKYANRSITGDKIASNTIQGRSIEYDVVLGGHPTVATTNEYEVRSIRNTILSPNPPSGGQNGDIWFRYM